MEADGSDLDTSTVEPTVTCEEARAELARLLSDPQFHCADRNKRFLQFISEELFEGRQDSIKAYTVAVDVFGRPASFDPGIDPIVRIEATRLRASLSRYYELNGHRHDIHIDLPRGRYVPDFVKDRRSAGGANTEPEAVPDPPVSVQQPDPAFRQPYPNGRARWSAIVLGVVGGLLLGATQLISFLHVPNRPEAVSDQPTVAISTMATDRANGSEAGQLRDAVTAALSRFQTLRISTENSSAEENARYGIVLKYDSSNTLPYLWWQVVDKISNEALATDIEYVSKDSPSWTDPSNRLIGNLANRIAGDTGIIHTALVNAELAKPSLGNGCVLRAHMALKAADRPSLDAVRSCLVKTIELRPNDADAYAMLAMVLLASSGWDKDNDPTARALDLADKAAALEPDSVLGAFAQMMARYRNGQPDAAIASGRRAMDRNPFDAAIALKLGGILFLTGRWDEGISLLSGADGTQDDTILAFDAYRRGAYDEAQRYLQQVRASGCYLTEVVWIATLGKVGRTEEAAQHIAALRRVQPRFEESVSDAMTSRSVAPSLAESLKSGLEAAGLHPR
ncbi:hypothetical protein [Mesorhizobium sp. B2-1-3A]|uniref:tetratricopeptide repeat protein n=1 Tax=Mesorhizobium sp. B2-1-3A TaxID=2589971 RepID=UPI00112AB16D|nr:hypothetical protein [Mesorhizobium sp. B2-1-3A]TPM94842.1 hypothetical protein FJ977_22465 [Mesorhizobium sp. B2-1-3A]